MTGTTGPIQNEKRRAISNSLSNTAALGTGPEYRVTVVAGRSRPRFRNCIYRKRNPAGGWDAVYISGREHLKDILLASKGATQVQVRENDGPREV